jgi:hypothetical protein
MMNSLAWLLGLAHRPERDVKIAEKRALRCGLIGEQDIACMEHL